jgi:hypothetical protein
VKTKKKKCDLKACLNEENGECTIEVPTLLPQLSPGTKKCKFFETNEMMLELVKRNKMRFKDEAKDTKKRSKKNKKL